MLRIKQAETALADGRLDEALRLADEERLRSHYRGQQLVGRLLRALVERARGHLEADRLADALADVERAGRLERGAEQVAAVREAVAEAMAARHRSRNERAAAVAAARRCVEQGWLSGGAEALAALDGEGDGDHRPEVERVMAVERARVESTLRRAEAAVAASDWLAAAELIRSVRRGRLADERIVKLAAEAADRGLAEVRSAWEAGRLVAAQSTLAAVRSIAGGRAGVQEMESAVQAAASAWADLNGQEPGRACRTLRRLMMQWPEVAWLREAAEAAEQAARAEDAVHGTALAALGDGPGVPIGTVRAGAAGAGGVHGDAMSAPASPLVAASPSEPLPHRFLLQVEGVGVFPVVCSAEVGIGPVNAGGPAGRSDQAGFDPPGFDIPLVADPHTPAVRIRRTDEDYFLSSDREVRINRRPTHRTLLTGGDRLELSRHCRLRFQRPNAASTTATVELAVGRMTRPDVRLCVLADREIVIGSGPTAHICAPGLSSPIVLRIVDGQLVAPDVPDRAREASPMGGGASNPGRALRMDEATPVGALNVLVKRF